MKKHIYLILFFGIFILNEKVYSQSNLAPVVPPTSSNVDPLAADDGEKPSGKRIRRQLNLIVGVIHEEEFAIPEKEITYRGRTEFFDMNRIKGTDIFRVIPKKEGNGIMTVHDKKTGQLLVEIRFDIRDDAIEKTMREVQLMLGDIEGIEFKIINKIIILDGYVLVPRDIVRIAQVIKTWEGRVKSLVTLSPIARKKIADFITNDINNPEVKVSAIGEYIKLEGQVNSLDEKKRINQIVALYLPDIVVDKIPDAENVEVKGRKNGGKIEDIVIDLITIKKDDERVEPPPKMIQIVAHFVKFGEKYGKDFNFSFSPKVSAEAGTSGTPATGSTISDTANIISNLLPKLRWSKFHGFAKVLDTASILVQDKQQGTISRNVTTLLNGQNGAQQAQTKAGVSLTVTPTIKSERSGLVLLSPLTLNVDHSGGMNNGDGTALTTHISIRDRQSAALGGLIKKDSDNTYGAPATPDALITLQASKAYTRSNTQFVVFVTPIIKSSASAGVDQIKKKFRLKD